MNDVHVIDLDKTMKLSFKCLECGWKGELDVPRQMVQLVCPQCKEELKTLRR